MSKTEAKPIKLPFLETIQRSFIYPFANIDAFTKITSIWFLLLIYEALTDFPAMCNLSQSACSGSNSQIISVILMALASISISVAFCRHVILKEERPAFHFSLGLRELKFLGYTLLIIAIILIPSLIAIFTTAYFFSVINASRSWIIVLFIYPIIFTILCSRFYLVIPAVAVDNKDINLKESARLTLSNCNRIFWGQVIVSLPMTLSIIVLSYLFATVDMDNMIIRLVFVTALMVLSFLDSCIKMSFFSHVYQYFMFFDAKKKSKK